MEILKLSPSVKAQPWGGSRLCGDFNVPCPENVEPSKIGEAWMLSCHPDSRSRVIGGTFDGKTLPVVLTSHSEYMGTHAKTFKRFPVLIKLIDAQQDLSIQVHPDDEYAAETRDRQGKTELWYIIDAEPDAEIIYGFKRELTQEMLRRALYDGSIVDEVERFKVKAGDVFFLEAGTVHAIGKGVLLCEIQQNSTAEYRMYDYDRTDENGRARSLRIENAIDVAITVPPTVSPGAMSAPVRIDNHTEMLLGECKYFSSKVVETEVMTRFFVGKESFVSIVMVNGDAVFSTSDCFVPLNKGESAFIPAGAGEVEVKGHAIFIMTTI